MFATHTLHLWNLWKFLLNYQTLSIRYIEEFLPLCPVFWRICHQRWCSTNSHLSTVKHFCFTIMIYLEHSHFILKYIADNVRVHVGTSQNLGNQSIADDFSPDRVQWLTCMHHLIITKKLLTFHHKRSNVYFCDVAHSMKPLDIVCLLKITSELKSNSYIRTILK